MRLPTETEIEASHLYESLIRFIALSDIYGNETFELLKRLIVKAMMEGMEEHEAAFSAAAIEFIEASQRENN
jgi:hypothetical protein